ncbi:aldehyde dehydrogenase family protein [Sorangium sp. So ce295]|uniref:aldehyde dehydrogenase family protein n=1 Tax=Sorangium sp. So ce295 TaxID=3133295 RepID=UPI003F604657
MIDVHHFIGGEFIRTAEPRIEASNPATEEVIGRQPDGGSASVKAAVLAARQAFESGPWCGWPASRRADCLLALADLLEDHADELARIETSSNGLPISQTRGGHIPRAIAHFRHFAGEALRISGESFPLDSAYLNLVHREPLGVVAAISPWNGPLAVSTLNLAAALAAGNTCVLKPSEKAPLSIWELSLLAAEAGFPPGVVNIVYGGGESTGWELARHPDVNAVCFVGASEVGRQIMADAASSLKKLTLELGGKSPTIVLADADLERAVDGALLSVFSGNGEVCTAGSRILVEAPIFARFMEMFIERTRRILVGDPEDPETEIGPLITRAHRDRVLAMIQDAVRQGAKIACGGAAPAGLPKGFYVEPTVLHDVRPDMTIMQEEIFGPVAALLSVDDANEAVRVANATPFGLSASIWSGDVSRALTLARRVHAGGVGINSTIIRDIRVPFGGVKLSGLGRLGGRWSIEQFTTMKTISLPIEGYALPRLGLRQRAAAHPEDL